MIGKQIVALTLLSAMADQTLAAPGHQHRQLHAVEKRAVEVEVVTKIVTVTVTYGAEPTKDDKGGIFVSVPDTTSTSVVAAPTVEQQLDNQKPASSSSSAQVQENAKRPSTSTSTSTAAVTTTAQPTTTAEPTTTAQPTTTAVPSSSSTSSAAPASTSASSGNSGITIPTLSAKRGIGYNSATMGNDLKDKCKSCGWSYNWETQPKGGPSDFYIPTYKSNLGDWPTWFDSQAQGSISSSSVGVAFSLNEPDNAAQGLVSPELAATLQVTHMVAMKEKTGVAISAPSVTNGQATDQGLNWLQSFVTACKATEGCHYDFCNLHWYDHLTAKDTIFSNLEKAHEICGTPVWLTEYAPLDGSTTEVVEFVKEVNAKLETIDYVHGYAFFMAGNAYQEQFNLYDASGAINAVGEAYAGL